MPADGHVCCDRPWIELGPPEDSDVATASPEDRARGSRSGAFGRERLPDWHDLTRRDGKHDKGTEALPEGGSAACRGQGACCGDQCDAGCAKRRSLYCVG